MSAQEATMTAPGTWRPRRRVLPRRSVRLRLTALYTALFLLSGAVLLAITGGLILLLTRLPGEHRLI